MSVHTIAFAADIGDSSGNFVTLPALADQTVQVTDGGVILSSTMNVIAAFTGTNIQVTMSGPESLLNAARVAAPSLRQVFSPYIVPTSSQLPADNRPAFMAIPERPWKVDAQEPLGVEVSVKQFSGSKPHTVALLWLEDSREQIPEGDNYWIRGTTQSFAPTPTALQWSTASYSLDQSLAAGRYAVIGFAVKKKEDPFNQDLVAARLIFDDQVWRPGTLVTSSHSGSLPDQTAPSFYDGSLGVLGYFKSFSPPRVEILSLNNSPTSIDVYLRVVRTDTATNRSTRVTKSDYR